MTIDGDYVQHPDFFNPRTLKDHVAQTMGFYHPRAVDPSGGFFHFFRDDGSIYDSHTRHLVSSTRFVFDYAMAHRHFGGPDYLPMVRHGLAFLREVHRNPATGGYTWLLRREDGHTEVLDATNHCYGLAFVLLAYAHALMAGVEEARPWLEETWALMEARFWEPAHGLYADEASADWSQLSSYRGQNANMHSCEAMLAAYAATGEQRYLERAETVAWNITRRQAAHGDGMIWEHYRADWTPDWDFNRADPANLFRPWGYQPGHFTEWAKLLLQLERHEDRLVRGGHWLLPTAQQLFEQALGHAWDLEHGGIHYGFAPDGRVCDGDKYFWVQAESLAAAALLADRTGDASYWNWYAKIWEYSWAHFVDHEYGAWYRILSPDNRKISDEKSPAGKVDYHTMGACYDVVPLLERRLARTGNQLSLSGLRTT